MSTAAVVGVCFIAFGIGWAGGALQRIFRQSVEALD